MAVYFIGLGKAVFILLVVVVLMPLLIYLERKGSAFIQDRVGPNRADIGGVRLAGLVHLVADVIKLIMKEMFVPSHVTRWYFVLAPFIGWTVIVLAMAVIPWADNIRFGDWDIPMSLSDLNGGLLFIFAITSLNVYGIVLAGWSSNNKYSLLGGLRSTAQMISYEIPLGLSVVGVFMVYSSVKLSDIVLGQGELLFGFLPKWGVFVQPLGFLIFTIAAFAESNRNPFDVAEGESEIVAGYHTEYSGIRFALFYMAEYVAIVLSGAMIATLFFGGWQVPWLPTETLRAHAPLVFKVLLGTGAVVFLAAAIMMVPYGKRLRWGDRRDSEAKTLGGLFTFMFLVHVAALVFFWNKPFADWGSATVVFLAQFGTFIIKTLFFSWLFIWVRWTLPRFRYDQIMRLGWKMLIPLSFINIFATALLLLIAG